MAYESDPGWKYLKLTAEEMAAEQSKPFNSKTACWMPDKKEGYVLGDIKSTKGDQVVVTVKGADQTVKKDVIQDVNPPKFSKCEDMSNLSFLNEAAVLWNLRDRYSSMLIYTYSGLFCVVINPYKRLPIYTDSVARLFMGKRRTEMPPHLFSVSDEAYRNMLMDHDNQSMLITGESGAGKTENTKKVIAYFASVGAQQAETAGIVAPAGENKITLEDQIVQTNPVLEAFGNAKTVRNNNSSRFGKFIRIHFSKDGRVASCDIEHYLLEKSRVIRQAPGERAYHIFYQIMSGHQPDLMKKLELLKTPKDYFYVNQAEVTIAGVDDKEEFAITDESFDILNFTADEKFNIYRLCAAIVHMGQMKFKQRQEQAEPDGKDDAEKAARNFGLDPEEFLKAFCKPRVKVGTEWVNKGQNKEQVQWGVGAMSKGMYSRMFDFLVKKCNKTLDQQEIERQYFIGVLDIAGFEIFDFNSFEQLWINFVNEKLQQFFNHHMFVLEQEEYQREGIKWEFIDFGLDLAACIELIEKPMGVISMLDEECMVPKGSDLSFGQKLNDKHLGKHPNFEKPKPPKGKQAEAHFALRQYAGVVRYNVGQWLEKNKDPLNETVVTVMKNGKGNELVNTVWSDYKTQEEVLAEEKASGGGAPGKKKGKSASFMTVSMKYRESLNTLMAMLNTTHPHFIRCLIPNELKKSGLLDAELVLNQLSCNGVLEGIRICRKGFPNRALHTDFKYRYAILAADDAKIEEAKECSTKMLAAIVKDGLLKEEHFKVGHTKVFFKAGILAQLEEHRDDKLSTILKKLQSILRWYTAQTDAKKREKELSGFKILQQNIRSWCSLRTWEWFKLFGNVKPLLKAGKEAEEREAALKNLKVMEESLAKEEAQRKELEEAMAKLKEEHNKLTEQLKGSKGGLDDAEDRINAIEKDRQKLNQTIEELREEIIHQEDRTADANKKKKKVEDEVNEVKQKLQDMEMGLRKAEQEKKGKDHTAESLQAEINRQDEAIAKLNREKKIQDENLMDLQQRLQQEEDKVMNMNRVKSKLESQSSDLDDELDRERKGRQELDRMKRKVEGEMKLLQDNLDEVQAQKRDLETNLKKRESENADLRSAFDDEQTNGARLSRQVKDTQTKMQELEEELECERQMRSKVERSKTEIQMELEDTLLRLDEVGGETANQLEINKKREAEVSRFKREAEELKQSAENQLNAVRKKHNEQITELGGQLDELLKQKIKMDKDRGALGREIEELQQQLDEESRNKANLEKSSKHFELQAAELEAKTEEQNRIIQDYQIAKQRQHNEISELNRQLEESETQLQQMNRTRAQLNSQLEDARNTANDEMRERHALSGQMKSLQAELDSMLLQADEENEAKAELMRQLSKANGEVQQLKSKLETEGMSRSDELEESRRKVVARLNQKEEDLNAANLKITSLEKIKARMATELDDAQGEVEHLNSQMVSMDKKMAGTERMVDEWKKKYDDLSVELDASQQDSRMLSTELFKTKALNEEAEESVIQDDFEIERGQTVLALRRENRNLAQEIKDLSDQLGEGGRSTAELQKQLRRSDAEKEEIQHALAEAEAALECEQQKVLRTQVEVTQIREEIEKRVKEKEEEFENTKRNHQRALESCQTTLDAEQRTRVELQRQKKKLEGDINEIEIILDQTNKANQDAAHQMRTMQQQMKEMESQIESEQHQREEARDQMLNMERRCNAMSADKEDSAQKLMDADRIRKQLDYEMMDLKEQLNDTLQQNSILQSTKRKAETELAALQADCEEALNDVRASEEQAKKAMTDATRLADELRQEQEHSTHQERLRKGLESTLKVAYVKALLEIDKKELQQRLDDAEAAAYKGGRKAAQKLETRVHELEAELDNEQKRSNEALKVNQKLERRLREVQMTMEDDKKNCDRLTDLIDKLQQKVKSQKKQVEDAEELATVNLQKYRQALSQLEEADERADAAENAVSKLRAKSRSGTLGPSLSRSSSRLFQTTSSSRLNLSDFTD